MEHSNERIEESEDLYAASLDVIADDLRSKLRASRVTIRIANDKGEFPVVAEARLPGVQTLFGVTTIDPRAGETFLFVERELRPVVQDDILLDELAPPPGFSVRYGARAQMLAPVVRGGRLLGVVSVHQVDAPRHWSISDLAILKLAAESAQCVVAEDRDESS
ncbi:MAG: GAF domain-containing protein [Gaiellaceae bacterium MAG52_C11]|nr:GAF domain-containing protein [Candidatus Gaiellasilicea maunaloa]